MARAVLAGMAVLVIASCGAVAGQGTHPLPTPPTTVLGKWKDFPVNAHPRPIIAFGDTAEHIQASGFPNGDRKVAWMCNRFVLRDGLSLPTSTAAGQISASLAYSRLMAERSQVAATNAECSAQAPFVITAARLATAGFPTDRGTRQLPAWLFEIPEVNAYIGQLALDPSTLWGGGVVTEQGRGAQLSAGGRTLKVPVANMEPGPCGNDYTAAAAESPTAVAVAVRQFPHAAPAGPVACDLVLRVGYISLTLEAPLGGRVLLDEHGAVGMACPENEDC